MTDDPLLSSLGQLAQEQQKHERRRLGDEWDALSADKLDSDARARLEERAGHDPLSWSALKAFEPLGQAFESSIAQTVRDELDARRQRSVRARWSAIRRAVACAAVLLIAVGLFFILDRDNAPLALPLYDLEVTGGVETTRSAETVETTPRLAPGCPLRLVLRPRTTVDQSIATRLYLRRPNGALTAWPFEMSVTADPSGAVLVESAITREEIPERAVGSKPWSVVALVGRESDLPNLEDLGGNANGDGWRMLERSVLFVSAP